MTNEGSEYLSYFPEWAGLHRHISGKYAEFCLRVEQTHQQLVTALSVSGKSYQSAVENHVYRQYLLALHEGAQPRSLPPLAPIEADLYSCTPVAQARTCESTWPIGLQRKWRKS